MAGKPLDTIMATRLFPGPPLNGWMPSRAEIARWLSSSKADNEYVAAVRREMEWVCSEQSCQMAEVTTSQASSNPFL